MQNLHSYDTTAQAMTEVALALSMAFFALLIVALLSFQLPQQNNEPTTSEPLKIKNSSTNQNAATEQAQFVFFYQGKFVDQQLKPTVLADFQTMQTTQALVLAVPASLTFSEVMDLENKINHPNLSITLISEKWQTLLEQKL